MNKRLVTIFDNETAAVAGLNALRSLAAAVHCSRAHPDALRQEAEAKAESLKLQLGEAEGDVRGRIEDRVARVKDARHACGAELAQSWSLAKEALAA